MTGDGMAPKDEARISGRHPSARTSPSMIAQLLRATTAALRCAEFLEVEDVPCAQNEYLRLRDALDELDAMNLDDDTMERKGFLESRAERLRVQLLQRRQRAG
jgi:hypothetical protein